MKMDEVPLLKLIQMMIDTERGAGADSVSARIFRKAVEKRVRGMEATIAKLPKTADGVPIVPGMKVWVPSRAVNETDNGETLVTGVINFNACGCDGDGEESFSTPLEDCHRDCGRFTPARLAYSTEAAAILSTRNAAASDAGTGQDTPKG